MAKAKEAKGTQEESAGVDFSDGEKSESLVINLNEVGDSTFEAIPRGMYNCVVDELSFEHSQRSGNPMWSWRLEVEDGDYAGRKLFFHTVFAGDGLSRTKKTISRVAPELLEGPFNPQEVADNGTLVGRRVKARVDIRPYEGEQRNNVKDLFPPEDGGSFM